MMDGSNNNHYQDFFDLIHLRNLPDIAQKAANCETDINRVYALPLESDSSAESQDLYVSANQFALLFGLAGNIDTGLDTPRTDIQTAFEKFNAAHFPFVMVSATRKGNRKSGKHNTTDEKTSAKDVDLKEKKQPPLPSTVPENPENAPKITPEQQAALNFIYLLFNCQYEQFAAELHQGVDINFVMLATSPANVPVLMSIRQFCLAYLADNATVIQAIHQWETKRAQSRLQSSKKKADKVG